MGIKMAENEKLVYKKQWKKKYLKHLCGFANSNGGTIYIEKTKDQSSTAIMVDEIRNKIEEKLGISALINETDIQGVCCIEISVAPSERPVAYNGYYYGEGSDGMMKLEGKALVKFISDRFDAISEKRVQENSKKEDVIKKDVSKYIIKENVSKEFGSTEKEALTINSSSEAIDSQKSRTEIMAEKLIALFKEDPYMKQETAAERLGISLRTVKRIVRGLTEAKRIGRAGGRRYGYWEIFEES